MWGNHCNSEHSEKTCFSTLIIGLCLIGQPTSLQENRKATNSDGLLSSLPTNRLGYGFNQRVALSWAPVRIRFHLLLKGGPIGL